MTSTAFCENDMKRFPYKDGISKKPVLNLLRINLQIVATLL